MIEEMGTIHMTEAEVTDNFAAVLENVQKGIEIIVEQNHRPIAVIHSPKRSGRLVSDILREAKQRNSSVTLDSDFGKDLEAIIASHQHPWNPPSWE